MSVFVALLGCGGTAPAVDTAASTTARTDTATVSGLPDGTTCDPILHFEGLALCAVTDAPQVPTEDGGAPARYVGSGEIVAAGIGSAVPAAPGDLVEGFRACGNDSATVQILDDAGATWTLGWSAAGAESLAALPAGARVDFVVGVKQVWKADDTYQLGFALSDAVGPLVFAENLWAGPTVPGVLDRADRGDVGIGIGAPACLQNWEESHAVVTVSWNGGWAELLSGGEATVPVLPGPRDLSFHLTAAYENIEGDCWVGCDSYSWIAWPAP